MIRTNISPPLPGTGAPDPAGALHVPVADGERVRGLTAGDFRKIAPNGFGDPYNAYAHSMIWFNGHLMVGTTRANLAYRGMWNRKKHPELLGDIWPVRIPDGYFDIDLRAEIWRYEPPNDRWERVFQAPTAKGVDGYDVSTSIGFRAMRPFQGRSDKAPALYVPTWGSHQTPATQMMRSEDGVRFEVVSEPGLGLPDPKPRALRGLVPFKGKLFTSPAVGQQRHLPNLAPQMLILASDDPAVGDWKVACESGFGDPNNLTVFQMVPFNGYLYAGTINVLEGYQIWKTDAEGDPPYRWIKVMSHGAYRHRLNQGAITLQPFGGYLYVGGGIQDGGFDADNKVGPAAPEVIRLRPDDTWDLITGEPRQTPDGLKVPLSGLGPGFGKPFAGYIWCMCVHEGWIYVGDAVWTVFLRYSRKGERWPARIRSMFAHKNVEKMIKEFGGCDLWRSRDGVRWLPVTQNGFGNYFNMGFRTMVSTPHGMFVGSANPFAPDVAVDRSMGWKYEENPGGGLEVWLGSRSSSVQGLAIGSRRGPIRLSEQDAAQEKPEHAENLVEKTIREFYAGSGFRHLGYWTEQTQDAKAACDNLLDEVLALLPEGEPEGPVIEIGARQVAITLEIQRRFGAECLTVAAVDEDGLQACRTAAPDAHHILLARMGGEKAGGFAYALRVAAIGSGLARKKFLKGVHRLLRAGGRLAMFDVLCRPTLGEGVRLPGRPPVDINGYRDLLDKAGFDDICVTDVTQPTQGRFEEQVKTFLGLKRLAGELDDETVQKVQAELLSEDRPVQTCVLVSAQRP